MSAGFTPCPKMETITIKGMSFPSREETFDKELDENGTYQLPRLLSAVLLDQSKREIAIDIGAHVGLMSRVLSKYYQQILSFEPSHENRFCLSKNIGPQSNNVIVFPYALGDKDNTKLQLKIHPNNTGGNSLKEEYCAHGIKKEEVIVRTLDSITASLCNSGKRISLIKIDIQGAEEEAIIGGLKTIQEHKPIILCEIETKRGANSAIMKLLSENGYSNGIKWQKDAVFIHKTRMDEKMTEFLSNLESAVKAEIETW